MNTFLSMKSPSGSMRYINLKIIPKINILSYLNNNMAESRVRSLQQEKRLPGQSINLINNSNNIYRILCLFNSNQEEYDNVMDMAKQAMCPRRDLPKVHLESYVILQGKRLTIPANSIEKSKIVIYKPNTDEYFPLDDELFQEYDILTLKNLH